MFEQYTTKELEKMFTKRRIIEHSLNRDLGVPNSYSDEDDMLTEYFCRLAAEKYKDLTDEELLERADDALKCHWYAVSDDLSLEHYRRCFKAKGVTELPIRIVMPELTIEEIALNNLMSLYSSLELDLEDEKKSENPDPEKIKKLEKEIEIRNQELDEMIDSLQKKGLWG